MLGEDTLVTFTTYPSSSGTAHVRVSGTRFALCGVYVKIHNKWPESQTPQMALCPFCDDKLIAMAKKFNLL